jgi:hypothetical protein
MANGLLENVSWRDSKGHIARVHYHVANTGTLITQGAAATAVLVAMEAITNCALQSASGPSTTAAGPVAYGTTGNFAAVEDKAVYTFSAADGSLHRVQVPAPKIAIFEVDTITVDAAQTDSAAFITAYIANVVTSAGAAITSYVGGIRVRRKLQRKLTIFVKVPELDEPAE